MGAGRCTSIRRRLSFPLQRAQNEVMATGEIPIPRIPDSLMAEVERMAREQKKTVSQVVAEAVDRYVRDERWERLAAYGRERARSLGLTEADVPRLIEEARREHEQER